MVYTSGLHHSRYGYIKYPITKTSTSYSKTYTPASSKKKYYLGYLPPVCQTGCPCPASYPTSSYTKCYTKQYCKPGYVQKCNTSYAKTDSNCCDDSYVCSYSQANYNNKDSCYLNYSTPNPYYTSQPTGYQGYTAVHGGPNSTYPSNKSY